MVRAYDPIAARRAPGDPPFDVLLAGTVFLDIVFTGLPEVPRAGTEVWAEGMGSCPGGIANLATASSRLGLCTSLAAAFGDDDYGDFCWRTLEEQEGVDLSRSRRFENWHSPVTVSMSVGRDRSMVTHGHPSPVPMNELVGHPPRTRSVLVDLAETMRVDDEVRWVELARRDGALVFGDVGWDATGAWAPELLDRLEHCHAFLPNADEAMAYTRTETPQDALYALADLVPLAVVTNGAQGALAIDSTSGDEASVPALRVPALDPTGAGDVFAAALVVGTLAGWRLVDRLSFATLCSALAVQQFGGSLAAPGWGDVADWWRAVCTDTDPSSYHGSLRRRYAFLDDIVPSVPPSATRRAAATIARRADVPEH
ncbi:PfkB family carbohydrate kinase [Lapillicoccus sp.]|uniref:PfkB family carbohydrate kinase n=1 Tax=Lapillicoccus sp. TaxID=1909287 RepID=UPI003265D03F